MGVAIPMGRRFLRGLFKVKEDGGQSHGQSAEPGESSLRRREPWRSIEEERVECMSDVSCQLRLLRG